MSGIVTYVDDHVTVARFCADDSIEMCNTRARIQSPSENAGNQLANGEIREKDESLSTMVGTGSQRHETGDQREVESAAGNQSGNQSWNHPGNQLENHLRSQSGNQSGNQSTNQTENQSENHPGIRPEHKSGFQSCNQSGNQSVNQSGHQRRNQSWNQSESQSRNQIANQLSNQPENQLRNESESQSSPDSDSRRKVASEKRRAVKNLVLVSIAFLLNFNAFQGLSRLQSSLNEDQGLGVLTSSVIYAALVLSCVFLPKVLINVLGHKWTMVVSFFGYILWMASNGYAVWGTLIPTSILVGLVAAPLWTAQCSYFTILGQRYAHLNGETVETTLSRFFGLFFMFFQMSSLTGSLISSTVLKPEYVNPNDSTHTMEVDVELCGVHDCPWNNSTSNANLRKPSSTTVWIMVGVYMAIACLAVLLVAVFVDNLPETLYKKDKIRQEILSNLVATFKHLRHKRQLLIIPLTMYSGFEQAFFNAEWCKSFISCSLGIWKVGLVTMPFGLVNVVMSITNGQIVKYTGRLPVFIFAMVVDLAIQFTMMFWEIDAREEYVFYILSACWGLTDGIWQTQINALYGCLFGEESAAAFSNYRLWESIGFIVAFAYSNYLCTDVKLAILKAIMCLGMTGYFVIEWMEWRKHSICCNVASPPSTCDSQVPEMISFKLSTEESTRSKDDDIRNTIDSGNGAIIISGTIDSGNSTVVAGTVGNLSSCDASDRTGEDNVAFECAVSE